MVIEEFMLFMSAAICDLILNSLLTLILDSWKRALDIRHNFPLKLYYAFVIWLDSVVTNIKLNFVIFHFKFRSTNDFFEGSFRLPFLLVLPNQDPLKGQRSSKLCRQNSVSCPNSKKNGKHSNRLMWKFCPGNINLDRQETFFPFSLKNTHLKVDPSEINWKLRKLF